MHGEFQLLDVPRPLTGIVTVPCSRGHYQWGITLFDSERPDYALPCLPGQVASVGARTLRKTVRPPVDLGHEHCPRTFVARPTAPAGEDKRRTYAIDFCYHPSGFTTNTQHVDVSSALPRMGAY